MMFFQNVQFIQRNHPERDQPKILKKRLDNKKKEDFYLIEIYEEETLKVFKKKQFILHH
jgi:hypothetical protein